MFYYRGFDIKYLWPIYELKNILDGYKNVFIFIIIRLYNPRRLIIRILILDE